MIIQWEEKTNVIYDGISYEITIFALNGIYCFSLSIEDEEHQIRMYPVGKDVSSYIEDLAKWLAYDYIAQYKLDAIMNNL